MSGLAGQDHQLARDVHTGQVIARIRLGVAHRACLRDQFRERLAAVEAIEQPGQRAGENAFDRQHFVAGIHQVTQRGDHRQAGTHRGLIAEARATGGRRRTDALVARKRPGAGLFVRGHHMDACGQPAFIALGDLGAATAVDHHRMRQMRGQQVLRELVQVTCLSGVLQCLPPVFMQPIGLQAHARA
ncbi:hypothetical protein D3C81_1729890 [compost metagenome]